jgi:NADPH:quinone reductase-like Zn-dependent oxidoreductase
VLRSRPLAEKITLTRAFETQVMGYLESGVVGPVVDRVLPAEEAAEAHRLLETNSTFGKVLLRW